jgi:hypothetical protein
MPTQNGIRLGRGRYFLQRLTPQAVSDLRQRGLVSFRKEQSALDLGFQDTVLRSQIFVSQQQLLRGIGLLLLLCWLGLCTGPYSARCEIEWAVAGGSPRRFVN